MANIISNSPKDEELFFVYYKNPSVKLRNKLVSLNLGLVRKVAYNISHQCSESYEDLEQIGYFGLIRAIERFNPHQGYAFSSFAIPYIRGEILHYLRDKSSIMKIPRRYQDLYNKAKKIRQKLTLSLGYPPTDTQIAAKLGVSDEEWCECQLAFQNRLPVSLDLIFNQLNDSYFTVADTLPDEHYQVQQTEEEEKNELTVAINQLDEKIKMAIEWVFFHEKSRKETAQYIGISPMTVTRHLKKGIEELSYILQTQIA
jgi:RNA polymerase sigma-B factor